MNQNHQLFVMKISKNNVQIRPATENEKKSIEINKYRKESYLYLDGSPGDGRDL